MRSPRRSFTPKFKALAVNLVNGGQPPAIAARELNISRQLLHSWVLNANKGQNFLTPDNLSVSQENELTQLKKENAQLRRENDSIKNTALCFSKYAAGQHVPRFYRSGTNTGTSLSVPDISTIPLFEYPGYVPFPQLPTLSLNGSEAQAKQGAIHACIAKHYITLSKSHQKTADYVLSNLLRAATMPIDQLANAAGISIATANRFAHALGFDSYPKFRTEVVSSLAAIFTPVDNQHAENVISTSCSRVIASSLHEYMSTLVL